MCEINSELIDVVAHLVVLYILQIEFCITLSKKEG